MSYSGGSGRSFGSKGSSQKKDRKRRQEFHKHKVKLTEEGHVDFEQLKVRVAVALDKLGHQVFAVEPGGYTFHNWMTSFNMLLDDFEERAGPKNLPKDYYDARLKLTADLLKPAETADVDWEIQNMETEINSVNLHMSELTKQVNEKRDGWRERASKIDHLKAELVVSEKKLEEAIEALAKEKKRQSFFSKVFSSSKNSSAGSAKEQVDSIRTIKDEIEKKIQELESSPIDSVDDLDNNLITLKEKLDELQQNLADWNSKKEELSQLSEKRVETTAALSKTISALKLGESTIEDNAASE
jgi:DNA repair exonuclease SbcCD ATPase subunit